MQICKTDKADNVLQETVDKHEIGYILNNEHKIFICCRSEQVSHFVKIFESGGDAEHAWETGHLS